MEDGIYVNSQARLYQSVGSELEKCALVMSSLIKKMCTIIRELQGRVPLNGVKGLIIPGDN